MARKRQERNNAETVAALVDPLVQAGWIPVNSSEVLGWAEDGGEEVQGEFRGCRTITTQFGEGVLVDILTEDGLRTYGCPAVLAEALKRITVGSYVLVANDGKTLATKSGTAYAFRVYQRKPAA